MVLKILGIVAVIAYIAFNLIVAKTHSVKEMKSEFVMNQCVVGMVCANIFYAPAWFLKVIRGIVVTMVK